MNSRADEIRKRIARRKKENERLSKKADSHLLWTEDEERYGFNKLPSYDTKMGEGDHPLFRKELFLFKLLASACIFLLAAILFKNETARLNPARDFVMASMEKDFQFAAVSGWYEDQFGKPLAFLPFSDGKKETQSSSADSDYALPASAKILEDFNDNGQRITIETGKEASVEAMSEGLVRFAGKKDGFGNTVIIQHGDKSESWYGNLADINVNPYQYIEKGTGLGTAGNTEDGEKGSFYFAIKKGDDFIDPIQVIPFE
ncbi:M23 family metallopeptidase [Bacillus sp. ISL-47]|uniref:M23 family metallopeptidase n=1 Tax=Bacillus sp. ISL-47 TaxID=2819130 RepID=UPI001BE515B3|nr:M23 family metallopeptidase [Bacillus sp. ISL-47]MBT2688089.1 M23 family metallopeptidase [Bacillus sp. ISL-47]MBT2707653.1 M23 family metallopeptidase [Pseudomonas sp. ISL-84]